ncbi:conjugal transfer protein TrbI, partial [Flavobacterium cupreum]
PGEKSNKRSGVRRVNNLPIYIMCTGLVIFLLVMILVASGRAEKQNDPAQGRGGEQAKGGDTNIFAREIAGNQKDGIVKAKAAPLVVPDLNAPPG